MSPRRSGSGVGALVALLVCGVILLACKSGSSQRCGRVEGALPGVVRVSECEDHRRREVDCQRRAETVPDAELYCACSVDGVIGKSFVLFSDAVDARALPQRALEIANRRCGWDLATR